MVFPDAPHAALGWHIVTRLGEAQILLPAMAAVCAWLAWRGRATRLAGVWLAATAAAALLTTASKVAFIGFGWGVPALDFTGFSGHAMFAAAVWPPLLRLALARDGPTSPAARAGWWLGWALAVLVAVSRVQVQAHSWSEVLTGFALGAAAALATGAALRQGRWPAPRWWTALPVALLGWSALTVSAAPPSRSHDAVTHLALAISGHRAPFHRSHLGRRGVAAPAAASLQPR